MKIPGSSQQGQVRSQRINPNIVSNNSTLNAGKAISGIVEQYKSQRDHDDLIKAKNTLNEQVNMFKAEQFAKEGEEARGSSEKYQELYNKYKEEISSNLSDRARDSFSTYANQRFSNEKSEFYRFEHMQNKKLAKQNFSSALSSIQEKVRINPSAFLEAQKELEETHVLGVGSGALSKAELQESLTKSKRSLRDYAMNESYSKDMHVAIRNIDQMGFGDGEKQRWLKRYQTDVKTEERKKLYNNKLARENLMENIKGMEAIAQEHGDVAQLLDAAKQLEGLGYDQDSAKIIKKAEIYESSYEMFQDIKTLPLKEASDYIGKLNVSMDPREADRELKVRDLAVKFQAQRVKQFNDDPAGFVSQFQVGRTGEEIISSRLKAQSEQGISPRNGFKALTKSEAKEYKVQFENAATSDQVKIVADLQNNYGKHTNKVLREIGLSPTASLVTHFPEGKSRELFLSATSSKKIQVTNGDKYNDYVASAKNSDVMDIVNEVRSMMGQNPALAKQAHEMERTIANISALQGDIEAGPNMFDENFNISDDVDKKIFYPKSLDESDVEYSLNKQKQVFKTEIIQNYFDSMKENDLIINEGYTREELNHIVDQAVWVNSNDGFVLVDEISGKAISDEYSLEQLERDKVDIDDFVANRPIAGRGRDV